MSIMWRGLYVIFLIATVDGAGFPVVDTKFGRVRGKLLSSARNLPIAAYLGIPYAVSPTGELRFQSPKPWTEKWNETRDATMDGSKCVQLHPDDGSTVGTEDCLYLNIFVPLIPSEEKFPVLVFVHGGGFNKGSNNSTYFAPDYLMDQKIILVTVNYRLGIFGFLSTATEQVPGNVGLKDIRESLNWVQNNIMDFGGDPKMVTLAGQSGGAAAVHHLALSPATEGLFDKYITQSGSAVAPWGIHPPFYMRMKYLIVAKELGCTTNSKIQEFEQYLLEELGGDRDEIVYNQAVEEDERIISCFRHKSQSQLVNAMTLFHVWKENPWCNFGPTVEVHNDDAIITKHPMLTIKDGEFRDIPWITGVVADEGLLKTIELFENGRLMKHFIDNIANFGIYFLECEEIIANHSGFIDALKNFYFPAEIETSSGIEMSENLTQMAGDGLITYPTYQAMNYQAELMNSSVYFYLFGYEGTFSKTYLHGIPRRYGVAHTDDLNYLFPCLNNLYADLQLHNTGNDWTMINIMTELWSSFIKDGIPRAGGLTPDWEPYKDGQRYMKIGSGRSPEISMEQDFLPVRMAFWQNLMGNVSQPLATFSPKEEENESLQFEPKVRNSAIIASLSISIIVGNSLLVSLINALF